MPHSAAPRLARMGLDPLYVATHEAGHCWALHCQGRSFRYVTIRPRSPEPVLGAVPAGAVRLWPGTFKGASSDAIALALAGGVIATAIWHMRQDGTGEIPWADHMTGARSEIGRVDYARLPRVGGTFREPATLPMLTTDGYSERLRDEMLADWDGITRLAVLLTEVGTVTGREAVGLLGETSG